MTRILLPIATLLSLLMFVIPVWAGPQMYKGFQVVNVSVNGKPLTSDVPAIVVDGRTLLPVRAVTEALGVSTEWDASTETVIIIGEANAKADVKALALENAALRSKIAALESENRLSKQPGGQNNTVTATVKQPIEGFRNVRWGSTTDDVRRSETAQVTHEETPNDRRKIMGYKDRLAGMNVQIGYELYDNKLIGGIYVLTDTHVNKNDYISDYEKLRKLLEEKYGPPKFWGPVWKNSMFKDNPDSYGLAVSAGHLTYGTVWETPESTIILGLSGDNYQVNLTLVYTSLDYAHLTKEVNVGGL